MNTKAIQLYRLAHPRIYKNVWRMAVARPWLKCFLGILLVSLIIFIYFSLNVPSIEFQSTKVTPSQKIQTTKSIFHSKPILEKLIEKKCKPLDIAMICAGYNSTQSLITVVKSILFYRSRPINFHFIVDEISRRTLKVLFETWKLPQVNVSFYSAETWIPKVSWIPNKHYSGVYGLLKLILPEVLTSERRVLILDTDVTVLSDIGDLWDEFEAFKSDNTIGLVENQSNWYVKSVKTPLNNRVKPWPALGRGFNTGVMLMDLIKLREMDFWTLWTSITRSTLIDLLETRLADQDIINAVIKENPRMVFALDCTWNVQLSDHTISDVCYNGPNSIKILHWNSPRKQEVRNKYAVEFNRMHRTFLEMDGNLLRRTIFGCEKMRNVTHLNGSDTCEKFTKGSSTIYRTHLFLHEYQYNNYFNSDIGLVTQCSADRIILLEELFKRWSGPISIAIYLTDAEVQSFLEFIQSSEVLKNRKNVAYHIVFKDGEFYPINYLRNIAISQISTAYIFQLDVDFVPQIDLYEKLLSYIQKINVSEFNKTALIVPAFETQRYRFTFPVDKAQLLKYLSYGVLYTFRYHVWAKGHAPTNYSFWKTAVEPYEVSWQPDFEPYIVVSKKAPLYDERFIGFGWNKVSYITHLTALGYKYIVLPDTFIIHRPHAPSLDIGKFRTDALYRRCLKKLKDKFVEELIMKYGDDALVKIKRVTKE